MPTIEAALDTLDSQPIRPEQYGAVGDGTTDDYEALTDALTAAASDGRSVVLSTVYATSETVVVPQYVSLAGVHRNLSGLHGLNVTGPILSTWDGTSDVFHHGIHIQNLRLTGTCDVGMLVAHCQGSVFENVLCASLTANEYNFCFEMAFSNICNILSVIGSAGALANFKVNRTVLDTIWNICYTNSTADYNLHVDANAVEYATGASTGFSQNVFNNFTAQGGQTNGLYIENGTRITFNDLYTENCINPIRLGSGQEEGLAVSDIVFNTPEVTANNEGASDYNILMDGVSGIHFNNPRLSNKEIRLGRIYRGCSFNFPTNAIDTALKRTADADGHINVYAQCMPTASPRYELIPRGDGGTAYRLLKVTLDSVGARVVSNVDVPLHA